MTGTTTSSSPLVSVDELAAHLDDPGWVIIDCRFSLDQPEAGRDAYAAGHIPGAHYADLDRDLAGPVAGNGAGGRHPLPGVVEFRKSCARWGVDARSRVVAYDDAGGAIAARLWWLLRWCGHEGPAVLDGGLGQWLDAGQPLEERLPEPGAGSWQPRPGTLPVCDAATVERRLAAGDILLLDARAAERFAGLAEPLDARAGHVPGARNAPLTDNLDADKCFRSPAELQAYYRALALEHAPGDTVCMCGSGVTACHTLLALEVAGMSGASLYPGSWSDWISDGRRPIATEANTEN